MEHVFSVSVLPHGVLAFVLAGTCGYVCGDAFVYLFFVYFVTSCTVAETPFFFFFPFCFALISRTYQNALHGELVLVVVPTATLVESRRARLLRLPVPVVCISSCKKKKKKNSS